MTGQPGGQRGPQESGSDGFGLKLRWYLTRVAPPVLGTAGVVDQLFVQESVHPWRMLVSLGLIGVIPLIRALDFLGGGGKG